MAKPKFPRKGNDTQEGVTPNPSPTTTNGSAAEVAASPAASETKKAAPKKTVKKPEIVKSEPRANLVPINLEDEIRRLAYLLSERRGFETGHETDDWLAAEQEVLQRYRQHTA